MAKRIVILGGGIAGLAAAWFIRQKMGSDADLLVLEKSPRAGGWIQTQFHHGYLFEQGPRSFRVKSTEAPVWQMIEQLGLQSQLIPSHADASARYVYYKKQLEQVPRHLWNMPFSPLTPKCFQVLWREFFSPKADHQDESIYNFFSRRTSVEWTERLVDPFVSGIYAGDITKLSAKSCFPQLYDLEQAYGSLIKGAFLKKKRTLPINPVGSILGKAPFFSFQNGMETLTDALYNSLKGHIQLNCSAQKIVLESDSVHIQLDNSDWVNADYVISALPSFRLAALLHPKHPFLGKALEKLNYASVMVVNLGYRKPVLKQKGFGYLIPSQENETILGCVWDSCVFPQQAPGPDSTRMTVMLGGAKNPEIKDWSEEKGIAMALSAMERQLGIDAVADSITVKIAKDAIPQYELGYALWSANIEEQLSFLSPRIQCIGSAFNGVSVSDCIAGAHRAANALGLD